jgi:transcriptional pleiotropic repressor
VVGAIIMSVLLKMQTINAIREKGARTLEILKLIASMVECDLYLTDSSGNIIGSNVEEEQSLTDEFKDRMIEIENTLANISLYGDFLKDSQPANVKLTVIPLRNLNLMRGHLLLVKAGSKEFSEEDLILAEILALIIDSNRTVENADRVTELRTRQPVNLETTLGSLTFTEIKTVQGIFVELNGKSGTLVIGKFATKIEVSRSVIMNAIRKLESAGILYSRSIGTKGTYIEMKNPDILKLMKERGLLSAIV